MRWLTESAKEYLYQLCDNNVTPTEMMKKYGIKKNVAYTYSARYRESKRSKVI